MTGEYENSVFSRENGIYHFAKYSKEEALALIKRDAEADMKKAKAKEAALAAKKAAAKEKAVKKPAEETEKAVSTEGE
jgi:hypothetical protein